MTEPTPERHAHDETATDETAGAEARPSVIVFPKHAPPPPDGTILAPDTPEPTSRGWFLFELWAEVRLAARMYFDPRYRISRLAQVGLPLILVAMVVNYFFFSLWSIAVVSPVLERLVVVVLAVFAYRVLARELDRYRAVLDYLARYRPR